MNHDPAPPPVAGYIRGIQPTKPSLWRRLMARLAKARQSVFVTPAEAQAAARDLVQQLNAANAAERQKLRESILMLVEAASKPVKNAFEVKLFISREVFKTHIGEAAAVEIATELTHEIIRRHRALHDQKPISKVKPAK